MRVHVPDFERFRVAHEELMQRPAAAGFISSRLLIRDGDPGEVLLLQQWDSHEAFNAFADEVGGDFNRRAGTEDAAWDDSVWREAGTAFDRTAG
jgi:heme-degrading monooxygenase HmoA